MFCVFPKSEAKNMKIALEGGKVGLDMRNPKMRNLGRIFGENEYTHNSLISLFIDLITCTYDSSK